jgi:uncharacterized protein YodC (DUF2158 family)
MELRVGDVVQQKSGGSEMTIEEISSYSGNKKACMWFDGNSRLQGLVAIETLEQASD